MTDVSLKLMLQITTLTIASGVFDSLAFTYSSRIWQEGKLVMGPAVKAAGSFTIGIAMYWTAIRYLVQAGVVLPEIQTLIWFGVTIIGVAILGGRVPEWAVIDRIVGANVILSIGWLITRTSA